MVILDISIPHKYADMLVTNFSKVILFLAYDSY